MNFLMVSSEGLCGDLAWWLSNEGQDVKLCIEEDWEVLDGFVVKVKAWSDHVNWADVIIFDDVGFGEKADQLRRDGKLVVGGSAYTDKLEIDRGFGQEELGRHGVNILPHWEFSDLEDGIEILKTQPGRYVFKPSGFASSEMNDLVIVSEFDNSQDIIELLQRSREHISNRAGSFQLQRYVYGIEVAIGAFFNGLHFITPINVNFEHKRFFPGDLGPNTGEMGTLMYWAMPNSLFKMTLGKMEQSLRVSGYVGYIDLNCIVNAHGVFPMEFTSRFGYPTISVQLEGIREKLGPLFERLGRREAFELDVKSGFQVGAVIAVPPFPYEDKAQSDLYQEMPIMWKQQDLAGIHLGDVKMKNGRWFPVRDSGYVLVVTGAGVSVPDARRELHRRIETIVFPNMYYRNDIGVAWEDNSKKLKGWGYID